VRVALSLHRLGLSSDLFHGLGFGSMLMAISLWGRSAVTNNKDSRARAERLAIFIGLWPPTFFLLGKVLQDIEKTPEEQAEQAEQAEQTSQAKGGTPERKPAPSASPA
jgi:hypothetical protein